LPASMGLGSIPDTRRPPECSAVAAREWSRRQRGGVRHHGSCHARPPEGVYLEPPSPGARYRERSHPPHQHDKAVNSTAAAPKRPER
jgi:hypothetical protein